jgi:tRNA dimethylallyltransferase
VGKIVKLWGTIQGTPAKVELHSPLCYGQAPYLWGVVRKKLYVIVGPTAVGKTALAILLAKKLGSEIMSADSRQIYREMTIGTAVPSSQELAAVKHHFIHSHSVTDEYNAGQYEREAYALIESLFKQHTALVLVGGSGLYVKALLDGFDDIPEVPDDVREAIELQYQKQGLGWLQTELQTLDPDLFEGIDQQNPHRLIRALEIRKYTGQSIREFRGGKKKQHAFDVVKIGLEMDRQTLYARIDARVDAMIEAGLLEEVKRLYPLKHLNALQTVGYQEVFDWMDNNTDQEEAIRLLKRNSRRYAKRQLTWFKRDAEIEWFDASMGAEALTALILR